MKKIILLFFISFFSLQAQIPNYTATVNNGSPKGYYMLSPFKFTNPNSWQYIIDGHGDLVYYNQLFSTQSLDFKKHENGKLSYFNSLYDAFIILDSLFNPIDTITTHLLNTDGHELQILPNGHYLLLGVENTFKDLSNDSLFLHNQSVGSHHAKVTSNVIQELDANKNLVFDWHANTHFNFDSADPFWLTDTSKVDWSHSNAIALDTDGNYLLSSRHFNEITKINKTNGNIIWRFGGKYNQFTFTGDTIPFYGQHDCRILPNGHLTLFDNGNYFTPHGARALEYEIDPEAMQAKLVWSYVYDSTMFSNAMGNVQRLSDKKTLVNYGAINKNDLCFNVVDSLGQELFNLTFATKLYSYRSFYYPNFPWQIQRPVINCFDSSGLKFLKVDWTAGNTTWNTGSTSPLIQVTSAGNYFAYAPIGKGGFVRSEPFVVNDLNKFCDFTGIQEQYHTLNVKFFPNPASNIIHLNYQSSQQWNQPLVYNITGKQMNVSIVDNPSENTCSIDVSNLEAGIYLVKYNNAFFKFIKN